MVAATPKAPIFDQVKVGDPLLYVRDRMGHKNVTTTAIYLHLINQLASELSLKHEAELEELFAPEK